MRNSVLLAMLLAGLCGCRTMNPQERRGAEAIARYGCGSCHTIPGIDRANGQVGPPLGGIAKRMYAAGVLLNTPDNLARWVQKPSSIKQTVMPDLGVTPNEASDIASFLLRK